MRMNFLHFCQTKTPPIMTKIKRSNERWHIYTLLLCKSSAITSNILSTDPLVNKSIKGHPIVINYPAEQSTLGIYRATCRRKLYPLLSATFTEQILRLKIIDKICLVSGINCKHTAQHSHIQTVHTVQVKWWCAMWCSSCICLLIICDRCVCNSFPNDISAGRSLLKEDESTMSLRYTSVDLRRTVSHSPPYALAWQKRQIVYCQQ